ncbi:MAG: hypothetical protein PHU80_00265 [Kiritimatiellae bacterium]|nr:hypothetical protein [Kiritimatiellia bacterium]
MDADRLLRGSLKVSCIHSLWMCVSAALLSALCGCKLAPSDGPKPLADTTPVAVFTGYHWKTLAGQPGGLGNVDGKGALSRFCQPHGLAFDATGNLYVADYYNYAIRKIAQDGTVTTLAGAVGQAGCTDGLGSAARFGKIAGLAADAAGNVYVADTDNHVIRKVAPNGLVTTLAGSAGAAGYTDGKSSDARFRSPHDVAVDSKGNLYVADAGNHLVRRVDASGAVVTLAGQIEIKGGVPVGGYADGKGAAARFRAPRGVAVDKDGLVCVADTENAAIRRITPEGVVTTLAGKAGQAGNSGGKGETARFNYPQSLALAPDGSLYVADTWNRLIRKVSKTGEVETVAVLSGKLTSPRGVAVDKDGNLAVSDTELQTISLRKADGTFAVLAGSTSRHGHADGKGAEILFNRPTGIAVDRLKNLTVSDNFSHVIRTVAADGTVKTLAGKAGTQGFADGKGASALFFWPAGLARDAYGDIFVADSGNHAIRKVTPDGVVTTLAGAGGSAGSADGVGNQARFSSPSDVAVDGGGNLFVADRGNHLIRRVSVKGDVSTMAGSAGKAGSDDGFGEWARFDNPGGVAVDRTGYAYVADTGNHTIRKIAPGGEVTTLAGKAGEAGGADGQGVAARFNGPAALWIDADNNLLVADRDNHMIRKVTPAGLVTTLGGKPNRMSCADGFGTSAVFAQPSGLTSDNDGILYVADACNNRVASGLPGNESAVFACDATPLKSADVAGSAEASISPYVWELFVGQPGAAGTEDGKGQAARFNGPQGLALSERGILFVADCNGNVIRKVTSVGEVTTLQGTAGRMTAPIGIAYRAKGYCYVTDISHVVWLVTPAGDIRRLAGEPARGGYADGLGGQVRFNYLPGVAADGKGNVFLADHNNHVLRRLAPDGRVSTLAGTAGSPGDFDGNGAAARFMLPTAVAIGPKGNLYVTDENRIRKISQGGEVVTLAFPGVQLGRLDGITVDKKGRVYAADRENHVIWRITGDQHIERLGSSGLAMGGSGWLITGMTVDSRGTVYVSDAVRHCIMRGKPAAKR